MWRQRTLTPIFKSSGSQPIRFKTINYAFLKVLRHLLCLVVFLLPIYDISAGPSDYKFEHISVDQGLPASNVKRIHQDSQGFLWFATDGGLIKYDGNNYEIYKQNPADPYSLTGNNISRIIESNYGGRDVLWIGLRHEGVCKFDLNTERCTRYHSDPFNPNSLKYGVVWALCESYSGALWIGTFLGIDRLDYKTGQFTHFLGDTCVKAIHEDQNGILWIGTYLYGLVKLNPETGEKSTYLHDPDDPASISNNNVESIYESDLYGRRILWIGTRRGLNKFDPVTGEFIPFEPDPENPVSLREISVIAIYEPSSGKPGELWLTGGPLRIFNPETEQYIQYLHDPDDPHSISSSGVSSVCEDESGLLWIGSALGINKLNRYKKPFNNYTHQPRDSSSLSSNIITSVYQDKDDILWIGTVSGVNEFDTEKGVIKYYPSSKVNTIHKDQTGMMWIGTNGNLFEYNPVNEKLKGYYDGSDKPNTVQGSSTRQVFEEESGQLWFATSWGLYKLDREKDLFTKYLPRTLITALIKSNQEPNIFWLGGDNFGLVKMNQETGHFIDYMYRSRLLGSLSSNMVYTLYQNDNGTIWLGTGAGLNKLIVGPEKPDSSKILEFTSLLRGDEIQYRDSVGAFFDENSASMYWNSPQYSFIHYTEENSLPSSHVVGILEDDTGNLWLSTFNGLSRFDPQSKTFRNYYKSDGLPGNQFVPRSCYKNDRGEFFFGSVSGLTSFYPDSIKDNPHIPPIVITDFQLFHKPVPIDPEMAENGESGFALPKRISRLDTLELSYRENVFSLEFAALDYHNPTKNQYAYKMEGFEEDWTYTDASNRTATYTNLDPGDYTFRVKGSNNDDLWNEEGTSLKIVIIPPWWETSMAYSIYIIIIGSIIFGAWRFQLSRIRLKHQVELEHLEAERYHEMDELKSRFFANISHEFRTPLTLILGPIEKVLSRIKEREWVPDLQLVQKQARRLLQLVSQLLDLSRLEARRMKLQASQRNIIPLLKGTVLSFASLADRKKITLTFNSDREIIPVYCEKDIIVKIINNLLSNAFKFTASGGKIEVAVQTGSDHNLDDDDTLVITVSDTGIGIAPERIDNIFNRFYQVDSSETREHEGAGIGLSLTKELVELHKGEIFVESQEGKGTTFTIRLPLSKSHLKPEEIVEDFEQAVKSFEPGIPLTELELVSEQQAASSKKGVPIVLIVEDNTDVRNYIHGYLEDYRCFEAGDGEEGLRLALKKIPDLIVSDIMMPKMDGVEFCKQIKSDERTSHIPVILLTAKADIESKLEGLETGADDYLTKPFEALELQVRVKNLIEQRRQLRERFRRELILEPEDMQLSSMDERFMKRVLDLVYEHLDDPDFNVELFSHKIFMSRRHLNRKLKALTDQTTTGFIRSVRLKRAAQLLGQQSATVSEIAYQVVFQDLSYFTECFRKEFGKTPAVFTKDAMNDI